MKTFLAAVFLSVFLILGLVLTTPVFSDTAAEKPSRQSFLTKKERDFNISWAILAAPQPDGKTKIEIAAVALGRGADFRKWLPESTELRDRQGGRIRPVKESKVYVPKGSKLAPVAPWLVAATAIDEHPGEAVAMGLLASAGKGELEGRKYTFMTNLPLEDLLLKTSVRHKDKNQSVTVSTPAVLDAG